jgi:hypothetical protein
MELGRDHNQALEQVEKVPKLCLQLRWLPRRK